MAKLILALDFGSTGAKVTLFDEHAAIVGSKYREYETYFPQPNYAMQSPAEWWAAFAGAVKELLSVPGVRAQDIACIAPSAQMSTAIPIDCAGTVLADPVWIWSDMRSTEQVTRICNELGGEDKLYAITGGGMTQETYTGFKIAWVKEHMPKLFEKTYKFLQVKEYISYRLTGELATDYTDASECAMMDIKKRDWSDTLLEKIGVMREKLLPIRRSDEILGHVTAKAARETGLLEGTPVCVGGGDVSIAAAGAGVSKEGECYIYIGSSAWMGVYSKEPLFDYPARMVSLCDVTGAGYLPHQLGYCGGVAHKWMRDVVNHIPGMENGVDYDGMEKMIAQSPVGAKGLVFLPFLRGGGAPYNELDARGCFLGLELGHTYADMCRAVMEGTAYVLREMVENLEGGAPGSIEKVMLIGGGSKSGVWRQIIADVLQRPVTCTRMTQEANAWGAAICGGVAIGLWESVSAAQSLVEVTSRNTPQAENAAVYNRIFELSRLAFQSLRPVYHELAELRDILSRNEKEKEQ